MRRFAALAAMLVGAGMGGSVLGSAPPVSAQTPYPPGPCTAVASTQVQAGAVAVGTTITIELRPDCTFLDGTPVAKTVNGVDVGTALAVDGLVTVMVTVLSSTMLSIDDPVLVPAICGENVASASGFSAAAGSDVSHRVTFVVDCGSGGGPPASVAGPGAGPGTGAGTGPGTGAGAGAGAAGGPSQRLAAASPAEVGGATPAAKKGGGPLAFTGDHARELVLAGAALLLAGAGVVTIVRRRARLR